MLSLALWQVLGKGHVSTVFRAASPLFLLTVLRPQEEAPSLSAVSTVRELSSNVDNCTKRTAGCIIVVMLNPPGLFLNPA